ncbi:hypothetical protein CDD83_372 [Cordyceps sp. RAO-2017]|nr:hypothetical protein CDD83_372 [Cordyceps sp. RAO-2017]
MLPKLSRHDDAQGGRLARLSSSSLVRAGDEDSPGPLLLDTKTLTHAHGNRGNWHVPPLVSASTVRYTISARAVQGGGRRVAARTGTSYGPAAALSPLGPVASRIGAWHTATARQPDVLRPDNDGSLHAGEKEASGRTHRRAPGRTHRRASGRTHRQARVVGREASSRFSRHEAVATVERPTRSTPGMPRGRAAAVQGMALIRRRVFFLVFLDVCLSPSAKTARHGSASHGEAKREERGKKTTREREMQSREAAKMARPAVEPGSGLRGGREGVSKLFDCAGS